MTPSSSAMCPDVQVLIDALSDTEAEAEARRLWARSRNPRCTPALREVEPALERFVEQQLTVPTADPTVVFLVSCALRHLAACARQPLPPLPRHHPRLRIEDDRDRHVTIGWRNPCGTKKREQSGTAWWVHHCPLCACTELELLHLKQYGDLTGRQETVVVRCTDCQVYIKRSEDR
jgi:hypothetical protein